MAASTSKFITIFIIFTILLQLFITTLACRASVRVPNLPINLDPRRTVPVNPPPRGCKYYKHCRRPPAPNTDSARPNIKKILICASTNKVTTIFIIFTILLQLFITLHGSCLPAEEIM
ncbi:hypothetical protein J5N97_006444 [Dioscorea zingiberensis]|uniref:Uncharacterized protein n=1 Tax=Dioscorea zingiberensis TaxID=325984 RepID=A0A9D5DBV9_9LILI|nr:hypothetical protein J5N97_006444 [Dioscorea zingiberensis]